jgi:hypothetical protein
MYERITAADVKVGDQIGRAKTHTFYTVTDVRFTDVAVWLTLDAGGRIRPLRTAKLWRVNFAGALDAARDRVDRCDQAYEEAVAQAANAYRGSTPPLPGPDALMDTPSDPKPLTVHPYGVEVAWGDVWDQLHQGCAPGCDLPAGHPPKEQYTAALDDIDLTESQLRRVAELLEVLADLVAELVLASV